LPRSCTRSRPCSTMITWPPAWLCQFVRAPGSNVYRVGRMSAVELALTRPVKLAGSGCAGAGVCGAAWLQTIVAADAD
jgi:hypothetical protein